MESLVCKIKSIYSKKIFVLSCIFAICDVFLYKIVKINLIFFIYKDSLDFFSLFHLLFSSFKVNVFFIFLLSFSVRFIITTKLLTTVCSKEVFLILLFSFVFVTANSYEQLNNSALFLASSTIVFFAFFFFVLLFIFCLNVFLLIKTAIPLICHWSPSFPVFFEKHFFGLCFAFIFISWSPFIIFRYPAGIEWDSYHQLMMYLGDWKLTQQWPIVSTYFFGVLFDIGNFLFHSNDNGIFFTVLVQSAICASCFAYSLLVQKKLYVSTGWILLCLFFYSFLTIYPRYLTSIVKDALFSSIVVLFISLLAYVLFYRGECKKIQRLSKYLALIIISFLVCALRHTGVYIIFFCFLFVLFCAFRNKRKLYFVLSSIFFVSLAIFFSFSSVVSSYVGKNPLMPRLMYCIPLQQTARYISNNRGSINKEEIKIIDSIVNYDSAIKTYNPKLCDPMMDMFHADNFNIRIEYLKKIWWNHLIKSPLTYFAATYNQNEGFFFPFAKQAHEYANMYIAANWSTPTEPSYFSAPYFSFLDDFLFYYVKNFERFFVFFILCNCALNIWFAIFIIFFFYKKRENLLLLLPSIVILLTLVAGPTFYMNGERYALPIICCNLFLFSLFCCQSKQSRCCSVLK